MTGIPLSQPVTNSRAIRRYRPSLSWALRLASMSYLTLFILLPVAVISVEGFRNGILAFWTSITRPVVLSAVGLTLWTAAVMAVINTVMGTLTAYLLVNYTFPGKRVFNALIDLPFSIPTLVTGVMLVLLYGPQTAVGSFFEKQLGLRVLFAPPGIVLALLFVSYPFVIRAVQPVLAELAANQQEAAHTLGASRWATFRRIILPTIRPAMVTGALLSFSRALGEFGAIVVVSGNIPMRSQTASVYVFGQIEGGNTQGASSVSVLLLMIAFTITLCVDLLLEKRHA